MKLIPIVLTIALGLSAAAFAADPAPPSMSKVFDQQVTMVEREVVSLAEAMPADKYAFVPTGGEFSKSRTFGQQVTHIAAVLHAVASVMLGDAAASMGEGENGPASLKGKDEIVQYLKDGFAKAHQAIAGVTPQNVMEMIQSPFGKNKVSRLSIVTVPVWHSFDHYGQMAIYARLNGIVPPASR